MTGLKCELECTVIEIISCHGDHVPGADCRGHMGRVLSNTNTSESEAT